MNNLIPFPRRCGVDKSQTIAERFGLTYTQIGDYLYPNLMLSDDEAIWEEIGEYDEADRAEKYIRYQLTCNDSI